MKLTDKQIERYSRQIILPDVGRAGQERLLNGSALVVGTGGLGSPAAAYLVSAGVGRVGIVDSDALELNNLHRQTLHSTENIGRPKAESAKGRLNSMNPEVDIAVHKLRLNSGNIMDIIKRYDIVLDCSDNFPTRFLVNDACVISKKVFSHGGVLRFGGQAMTILPGKSACYRCLFPEEPPPGLIPGCLEAGILNVVPGVIGTIQANEALKYILGIGGLLTGRLLIFDALDSSFREVDVPMDPDCPVCGKKPTIKNL